MSTTYYPARWQVEGGPPYPDEAPKRTDWIDVAYSPTGLIYDEGQWHVIDGTSDTTLFVGSKTEARAYLSDFMFYMEQELDEWIDQEVMLKGTCILYQGNDAYTHTTEEYDENYVAKLEKCEECGSEPGEDCDPSCTDA